MERQDIRACGHTCPDRDYLCRHFVACPRFSQCGQMLHSAASKTSMGMATPISQSTTFRQLTPHHQLESNLRVAPRQEQRVKKRENSLKIDLSNLFRELVVFAVERR